MDSQGGQLDDEDEDEDTGRPAAAVTVSDNDPYSNLDSAFGTYMVDQPRPVGQPGRGQTVDDLLI